MLDSCAAVTVGPSGIIVGDNVIVEKSRCRIITASGDIVEVDGVLRFLWQDPENDEFFSVDSEFLIQLISGAKDWLLSMPELSDNGFKAYLNKRSGQSYLVFPNGFAVALTQEYDNCWSLHVTVYASDNGSLHFGLGNNEIFRMVSEPVFERVQLPQTICNSEDTQMNDDGAVDFLGAADFVKKDDGAVDFF